MLIGIIGAAGLKLTKESILRRTLTITMAVSILDPILGCAVLDLIAAEDSYLETRDGKRRLIPVSEVSGFRSSAAVRISNEVTQIIEIDGVDIRGCC